MLIVLPFVFVLFLPALCFFSQYKLSLYPSSAPGRRDLRVDCSGDACIVGHASGFAVGLSGPSDSDRSDDVAIRLRPPSPRRPLPLLELGLGLDLDRVLLLLLEVLCLGLLSSRRSLAPCKPLLPGCSSRLCSKRSPWGALRLCSALPLDDVDKSSQNLPALRSPWEALRLCSALPVVAAVSKSSMNLLTADIGVVSVECTLPSDGIVAKSVG